MQLVDQAAVMPVIHRGLRPPLQLADEGFNVLGSTTELSPNWASSSTLVERKWARDDYRPPTETEPPGARS